MGNDTYELEAFRWNEVEGLARLGAFPNGRIWSFATGVSDDGQVIVGAGNVSKESDGTKIEAFRWTPTAGLQGLGYLPDKNDQSSAADVSSDGSVIVGFSTRSEGTRDSMIERHEAFRWSDENGMVGLGELPGGKSHSLAKAVTSDGKVIVGISYGENGAEGFRWTEETGIVGLGMLPARPERGSGPFSQFSHASDISADGSVIVGTSSGLAAIWDQRYGLRSIESILLAYGVELHGWRLERAEAVSADGRTIVGYGTTLDWELEQPWVVVLSTELLVPELPTGAIAMLSILWAASFSRRRRVGTAVTSSMTPTNRLAAANGRPVNPGCDAPFMTRGLR